MPLKDLRKIGLTDGEIKVYDALLALGECTKTGLAKRSSVAPSNTYDIVHRLAEKGLASIVEKNGVAHFSPANPRHLLDFLDQKQKDIEDERQVVLDILPGILSQIQKKAGKVNVEVFYGWAGMKTVFQDLLDECQPGDKNYVFGAGVGDKSDQADRFFLKYSRLRQDRGIITDIIFNEEVKERKDRIDFFLKSGKYNVRFLKQSTPAEIMLYKDKTCILILSEEPLVIRITGVEASGSFRSYFDLLWAQSVKI